MRVTRIGVVGPEHDDYRVVQQVRAEVLTRAGGIDKLRAVFPQMIRRAIDEVIDTPRTKRLKLDQLEKTEKTYLGTKIEIFLRDLLGLPKGLLDLVVDGLDVDIKNTVGSNWMIPTEAVDKPCILVMSDELLALCQLGIIVAHPAYLTPGSNKDKKRSIAAAGWDHIDWILLNEPYPANFWEAVTPATAQQIMLGNSGTERLVRLFTAVPRRAIHRDIIQGVAQQKDYMKRLRKNGGARDRLAADGVALLSGTYDGAIIEHLGLGRIEKDEFIAVRAETPEMQAYLRQTGHID